MGCRQLILWHLLLLPIPSVCEKASISPLLVLGTGIVIGSAPPEKAGAAASISETSNQLGIALGVAFLGSIITFVYRIVIVKHLPAGLRKETWTTITESIAGATSIATDLNGHDNVLLVLSAKEAFVTGFHVVAVIGAVAFALLAFMTAAGLGKVKQ